MIDFWCPFFFFVGSSSLLPFLMSLTPGEMNHYGPVLLWFFALTGLLFSFDQEEWQGWLERSWLCPKSPVQMIAHLVGLHLRGAGLPFLCGVVGLSFLYDLGTETQIGLLLSFLLGLPSLSLLGVFLWAVRLGGKGGGVHSALLMLPFAVPVLCLGIGLSQSLERGSGLWPCICGLVGLFFLQGSLTFLGGSFLVKQKILT